jgi:hypothetical protein
LPNDSFGLRQRIDATVKRRGIDCKTLLTTNSLGLTKTLAAKGRRRDAVAVKPPLGLELALLASLSLPLV